MSYNIYHNLLINVPPKQVFDAVTLPEHLNSWWTLKASGKPELNSEYNLNFTDDYNWFCRVIQIKKDKLFYLKMTKADADWNPTTFGFNLEPKNNATYLKFSHTNWPKNNDHLKHSSFCWAMLLNGLKNYLEQGVIIPFKERN